MTREEKSELLAQLGKEDYEYYMELRRQMDALDQTEAEAASDEEPAAGAAPAEDAEAQEQHEDTNANG